MHMSNHGSFGVRRQVAAIAPAPKGKRRQVAALHVGLVICPFLARIRGRNRLAFPIALAWSLALALAPPAEAQAGKPPPGHERNLAVPRAAVAPLIDGIPNDDVWRGAAQAKDFWISEYGRAPREKTEVRVIADDKKLYFAFVCHDSEPDSVHAEQRKRDGDLSLDDHVVIELDPYHNHRQISEFAVNARGTQSDAMAGGRARKIEWKGDWQAAAQRTKDGWTAEMAIPFAILNFQNGAGTFGVNFVRYHHRTQEWSRWADVTRQFLPEEAGHLTDLLLPAESGGKKLTVMPYAAGGRNLPDKRGGVQKVPATAGLDARYDFANNLSGVFSVNPDFSQVENEVLSLAFDYNEKFRSDYRPFFQEGSAFFGDRAYFHGGRVPDFDLGVKSFGRVGALQLGMLGTTGPDGRKDYAARALREFGPNFNSALTVVGSDRADFNNQTSVFQAGGRLKRYWVLGADLAATSTRGRNGDGTRAVVSASFERPYWQAGVGFDRTEKGFFPADGFVAADSLDTRGSTAFVSYNRAYSGGPFHSLNGSATYEERATLSNLLQRRKTSVYLGGETRWSNIFFNVGTTAGPYRPLGADPGDWQPQLNNDRFYTASVYFNTRSDRYSYGLTYSWGSLGGGKYADVVPSFWVKPTRKTYVSYSYEGTQSFGVNTQAILSVSWEISPEQAISARWVDAGYYRLAYRRQVRRGIDIFMVFDADPYTRDRFTVKLTRTFSLW